MTELSILHIVRDTTVDGPGFRTAIYAAGCAHRCPGCHNPQSWDVNAGSLYPVNALFKNICEDEFAHVTFSGGDPLLQVEGFAELARLIKQKTDKNIWCYTGFSFEQIVKSDRLSQILPFIDTLVDGRYVDALRDESLRFRGSSNQRIIDVRRSLAENKVVIQKYLIPLQSEKTPA